MPLELNVLTEDYRGGESRAEENTRISLVGVAGFEPAASCSQGTRANQAALHPATPLYSTKEPKSQESWGKISRTKSLEGVDEIIIRLADPRGIVGFRIAHNEPRPRLQL
jgi:hypothetical protein